MRNLLYGFLALLAIATFSSCEDETLVSYLPSFYGFKMTWNNPTGADIPSSGDTVTFTACQKTLGNGLYIANYDWEVRTVVDGKDSVYRHSKSSVVYDHDKSDPSIKYIVPKGNNGSVNVRFSAVYHISSNKTRQTPDGGNNAGYTGTINTVSMSPLEGGVSGSGHFTVGH